MGSEILSDFGTRYLATNQELLYRVKYVLLVRAKAAAELGHLKSQPERVGWVKEKSNPKWRGAWHR
jgi:hypothetical protein